MTDRFFTRWQLPLEGPQKYVIAVRADDDPERETRAQAHARVGVERTTEWKKHAKKPASFWADRICEHLADGVPRTFNRICLELTLKTADVLFCKSPHEGLALAIADGRLACTLHAPVYIKLADEGDVDVSAAEAEPDDGLEPDEEPAPEPKRAAPASGEYLAPEELELTPVDLDALEDELLLIGDTHRGVALCWCDADDGDEGITVEPRKCGRIATVWADGLVQLHLDGSLDSEPVESAFTTAQALWDLLHEED